MTQTDEYALPPLEFHDVVLAGSTTEGRRAVGGLGLRIDVGGLTIETPGGTPRTLKWSGVVGLLVTRGEPQGDAGPTVAVDVALHDRSLRLLVPESQVGEEERSGLLEWAATRPFSAFSSSSGIDLLRRSRPQTA